MNTDLIGSVELTVSAAIVIAALSIGFGSNAPARIGIAAWLTAWFVIVAILAATRALYYERGLGAPGLGIAVALPIAVICILVARVQPLRDALHRVPLWLLVGVHTVRLLARLAYRRPANARPILWIWNVIGLVDLIAAVSLGVTSSPGPQRLIFAEPSSAMMTTLPWLLIPGFLVPLLFTVHIGIFIRLVSARKPALTSA